MATCEFYYDFSSPFAYLGATQIERACEGHTVVWKPFLLGALFKEIGTPIVPLEVFAPAKTQHAMADMHRWAEDLAVTFRFPSSFPQRSVTALRVALQAPPDKIGPLSLSLFEVMWVDDGDLTDVETLSRVITDHGLNPTELLEGSQKLEVKAALKANTDRAIAKGVCGAPSMVVGDLVFWGQDRLHFVKKALDGWIPAFEKSQDV